MACWFTLSWQACSWVVKTMLSTSPPCFLSTFLQKLSQKCFEIDWWSLNHVVTRTKRSKRRLTVVITTLWIITVVNNQTDWQLQDSFQVYARKVFSEEKSAGCAILMLVIAPRSQRATPKKHKTSHPSFESSLSSEKLIIARAVRKILVSRWQFLSHFPSH